MVVANALNINQTGIVKLDGTTGAFTATTTTNHNVLIGSTNNAITNVAPSATTGVALVSQGAAVDPAFGTVSVAGGGTGAVTLTGILTGNGTSAITASTVTNHGVLVGSASNAVSSTAVGSTGQVLQGNTGANPTYSTATYPSTAGTSGKVLISDGTNFVGSTPTFPNASATSGKFIQSDGTNWIASTPTLPTTAGTASTLLRSDGTNFVNTTATYPSTATGTGTILRADGTNWVATTATYPNTTTSQQILYSTATNVIGQLTTANSAIASTNSSGTLAMRALSVVIQTFTSAGTYTPTTGMLYCIIEVVGNGGGGGGSASTTAAQIAYGGGGGGGEYARGVFSASDIGASKGVTFGATGSGGTAGANNGTAGGTVAVTSIISAGGGSAGAGATATTTTGGANGGNGGTGGTGGAFRLRGGYGRTSAYSVGVISISGDGGSSFFSTGAQALLTTSTGTAGTGFGGGGGGGQSFVSAAAQAGGAGSTGIVVITEYVLN